MDLISQIFEQKHSAFQWDTCGKYLFKYILIDQHLFVSNRLWKYQDTSISIRNIEYSIEKKY